VAYLETLVACSALVASACIDDRWTSTLEIERQVPGSCKLAGSGCVLDRETTWDTRDGRCAGQPVGVDERVVSCKEHHDRNASASTFIIGYLAVGAVVFVLAVATNQIPLGKH
jgi:hypothetical protein